MERVHLLAFRLESKFKRFRNSTTKNKGSRGKHLEERKDNAKQYALPLFWVHRRRLNHHLPVLGASQERSQADSRSQTFLGAQPLRSIPTPPSRRNWDSWPSESRLLNTYGEREQRVVIGTVPTEEIGDCGGPRSARQRSPHEATRARRVRQLRFPWRLRDSSLKGGSRRHHQHHHGGTADLGRRDGHHGAGHRHAAGLQ